MSSLHRLCILFFVITAFFFGASVGHTTNLAVEDKAKKIWQLLDYLAVDYSSAVQDGKVTNQDEYAEMQEFAQAAEQQLAELPNTVDKHSLLQLAAGLKATIARKASPMEVADNARDFAGALLMAYPVPLAPIKAPSVQQGASIYQTQCASCHGVQGNGDGPLAGKFKPPPIAFSDRERAKERSLFALHQTITRGVQGTSMPSFAALTDEDRWALAFFVATMAFDEAEQHAGSNLWTSDQTVRAAIPSLETLTQLSESALAKTLPAHQAGAVLAHLRNHPEALNPSQGTSLVLSKTRLRESLAALEKGDTVNASSLALSAYLDGFEPIEPALAIKNKALFTEIEQSMRMYRAAISAGRLPEAQTIEAQLQLRLTQAQSALNGIEKDPIGVFLGALTILLREGIEALLVIVAMIAFLKKADRREVLPMVHAGWIAALVAGGLTWFVATYLVDVSGASRELTEGFSAIFAALVLLCVGIWMHQKSLAGQWQTYIRDKLSSALNRQSASMLFILAFVTVYREVFETVLFYSALWTVGTGIYLLAGLVLGVFILGIVAWLMLRTSARLPIGRFFAISWALVAVLAVVLIGKGVAALQEAGILGVTPITGPSVDFLGIYPLLETVMAQMAVAMIVVVSMAMNARSKKG